MVGSNASWISPVYEPNLVSVIVPTFNRQELLPEAIESIYGQNYRPIECVVVDDGSTDNTENIIVALQDELQSQDFTIYFLKQDNRGAPSARNRGTTHSSGEFIQYLDSDDLLYPDKIRKQVKYLLAEKECDGIFGDWNHGTTDNCEFVKGEKSKDLIAQFYGGRVIHTLSLLFRRRIVEKIGPWDIALKRNQEVDFNLRGVLAGGRFDYLPGLTGLWREHGGKRIVTADGALAVLEFHEKWIKYFSKNQILTEQIKELAAKHIFWNALSLKDIHKNEVLKYLEKVNELNPNHPEFCTSKMKFLRHILGRKYSLKLWYKWSQRNLQNQIV